MFQRQRAVFKALWPNECYHKWEPYGRFNAERCCYCKGCRSASFGILKDTPTLTDPDGMSKILRRLRDFDKFVGVEFSPIYSNREATGASIYWDVEAFDDLRLTPYKAIAATEALALFEAVEKLIKKEF